MKKHLFSALLTAILLANHSMAQPQPPVHNFPGLISNSSYPTILAILNNPADASYRHWLNSQPLRDSVIVFLDQTIEDIYDIKTNKFQFRNVLKKTQNALADTSQSEYSDTYQRLFAGTKIDKAVLNGADEINRNEFQEEADSLIYRYVKNLMTFLSLDVYQLDDNAIKMSVSKLQSQETIEMLLNYYEDLVHKEDYGVLPEEMQQRNLRIISTRLSTVQAKNYVLYQSLRGHNRKFKSVEFYMDNDVFLVGKGVNQDREYTGGGALSFTTDYLKWRWFNLDWIREYLLRNKYENKNVQQSNRMMLSYQSVKLGMQFYTPYIRYRNNFALADSLYRRDRPFGSYVYVERAKFRIWPKGLVRSEGDLQIGKIGTPLGGNIQATLHQDATVSSQRVYGWDKQVNNGGRWTAQLNHKVDFMLFSNSNKYVSILNYLFRNNVSLNEHPARYWCRFNAYSSSEIFLGTFYTAYGTGLYISAADFKSQSGQNILLPRKRNVREFGFNWEAGIKYRRVVHNSMLEGIGFVKTFDDDIYDDENLSTYVLNKEQIRRNLLMLDLKLAVRWRKITIYYSNRFSQNEYDLGLDNLNYEQYANLVSGDDLEYYKTKVIPQLQAFNKQKFYGYGRIGINWLME